MKRNLILLTVLLAALSAFSTNYYVDASRPDDSGVATKWATAKKTIQAAVNAATVGDTVLVTNGTYLLTSQISVGKSITIRSVNGAGVTVVDGQYNTRCFFINNAAAVVDGFTICHGSSDASGGGGVFCFGVVQNCKISGNASFYSGGGGVYCSGGSVRNCTISGNTAVASDGGGVYCCSGGTIQNCTISGNTAYFRGGGVFCNSSGTVQNSILYSNTVSGTGENWYNYGTGMSYSNCCISPINGVNSIAADPQFVNAADGDFRLLAISPCINAGINQPWMTSAVDLAGNPRVIGGTVDIGAYETPDLPTYAITTTAGSNGSIAPTNPVVFQGFDQAFSIQPVDGFYIDSLTVDGIPIAVASSYTITNVQSAHAIAATFAGVSYTLTVESGSGSGSFTNGTIVQVFSDGPLEGFRFSGWTVDPAEYMSCLADVSATSTTFTMPQTNVTLIANYREPLSTFYVDASRPDDSGAAINWATAKKTIQAAIDLAVDGDTVLVTNGVYAAGGKEAPPFVDPWDYEGSLVTSALTNRVCITKAITVRSVNGAEVTVIQGASDNGANGPAAVRCAHLSSGAVLEGFTLVGGHTYADGSGGWGADYGGGALLFSNAVLNNCVLSENSANTAGGGVFCMPGGVLNNCLLNGNTAGYGGGAAALGTLNNCTVVGNSAREFATPWGYNAGGMGGGVDLSGGVLNNCIVWGNMANDGSNIRNSGTIRNTCAAPLPEGEGNISADPMFKNPLGNFRLKQGSPCVDAGSNDYAPATDLDGVVRPVDGDNNGSAIADMGCYELNAASLPKTFYVDASRPDDSGVATNWATAKQTIQAAVDLAMDEDTVWVTNGVYSTGGMVSPSFYPDYGEFVATSSLTNRVCITKATTVCSVNGPEVTVIQGASDNGELGPAAVRCVQLFAGALMEGFTLTGGHTYADSSGGWSADLGGGAYMLAGAVLNNCVLRENSAIAGGGVFCVPGGILNNCLLSDNTAGYGGGAASAGTLNNCTVSGNYALEFSNPYGNGGIGGGVDLSDPSVLNNCIVWGNTANIGGNINMWGGTVRNTCSSPLPEGEGNICADPMFVDAVNSNFQLQAMSPCINAGNSSTVSTTNDLAGNLRIAGGTVDMGAYETLSLPTYIITTTAGSNGSITPTNPVVFQGQNQTLSIQPAAGYYITSLTVDGVTVSVTSNYTFTNMQSEHTIAAEFTAISYTLTVESGSGDGSYTYGTVIPVTADAAAEGSVFSGWTVNPAVYTNCLENIFATSSVFTMPATNVILIANYKSWVVYVDAVRPDDSGSGTSWATAKKTIQAAVDTTASGGVVRVAAGTNVLSSTISVPAGITVQGAGAGVTIVDGNNAVGCFSLAGNAGVAEMTIMRGRVVEGFNGTDSGGVAGGIVSNCTLRGNYASYGGGGADHSTLYSCTIISNSAGVAGGGVWLSTLYNCLIIGNSAKDQGGGAYDSTLYNCTVSGNTTTTWPATSETAGGTLYNSILYPTAHGTLYNCWTNNPMFVNASNGNFRLQAGSLCIDAGNNSYVSTTNDLDGNPRIINGTVDIGAYENSTQRYTITTTAGSNGSIAPTNPVVFQGFDQTISIQPAIGYYISSLTMDGSPVSVVSSYTFTNVQSTHTIAATFAAASYTLIVKNGSGDGSYTNETVVLVTADAAPEGYAFCGWTANSAVYTNRLANIRAASTTFTMPPTDVSLIANYAILPVVNNDNGVTNITANSATLCGWAIDNGGEIPNVIVYWGANDGGTNRDRWAHAETLGVQGGAFSKAVSELMPKTTYYYRCYATNSAGSSWADTTIGFVTLVALPSVYNNGNEDVILNTSKAHGGLVSMAEQVAVAGAGGESPAGAAYIFEPGAGNTWDEVKRLTASDAQSGAGFGCSVASIKDVVAVGDAFRDAGNTDVGSAYIFERNAGGSNAWGQVKKLTPSVGYTYARFGCSVALADDLLVVGASGEYGNGSYFVGAAYIYERNAGGSNTWGLVKKLTSVFMRQGDQFGRSLALEGDRLVVGAEGGFGEAGAAYIYERNVGGSNAWGRIRIVTPSDPDAGSFFGASISMSGDLLVVGAGWKDEPFHLEAGAAYIFERNAGGNNMWGQVKKLTASDADNFDYFGSSVRAAGDVVLVGSDSGTYVFERNAGGTNAWGEVKKWPASNPVTWGTSVGVKLTDAENSSLVHILDSAGATNVTATSATLLGRVTDSGGEPPSVIIYWGDNDGETNSSTWEHTETLGTQDSQFSKAIGGLIPNTIYYYRCSASNSAGFVWAPFTARFTTLIEDNDGDGIPVWWEKLYFGASTNINPAGICSNGFNTIREAYIAGLDPNDPNSEFLASAFRSPTSENVLQWQGVSGRVYSVYYSTNLLSGFQPLETNIPWTAGAFTDTVHEADGSGFYKIHVKLAP